MNDRRSFFFIVGAQRSGTTLLRLMLASHPQIAIPPESHFIPDLVRLDRRFRGLGKAREQVADWLSRHARLADFDLGADWIRNTVRTLESLTPANLTLELFAEYARRRGKVRVGDKTPRYREFIPELHELFSGARFIHVLRDGRDAGMSATRAFEHIGSWPAVARLWAEAVTAAREGARILPRDAFLEVRYESLLNDPETSLRAVCEFLGEAFSPEMLRFQENADDLVPVWERNWHRKLGQSLDPGNAAKWKSELTAREIFVFQLIAGRVLTSAGYPLIPVRLSVADHFIAHAQRFASAAEHGAGHFAAAVSEWYARVVEERIGKGPGS